MKEQNSSKKKAAAERDALIRKLLKSETANKLESEELLHMLLEHRICDDVRAQQEQRATFGQRLSDGIAKFVGSWIFIGSFCLFLALWMVGNWLLRDGAFDPYPYILLNLVLSCVAAIQAPLIMMSQNRQEEKDRLRAQSDYRVNLKSELILEDLHFKLDKVLAQQEALSKRLDALEKTENSEKMREQPERSDQTGQIEEGTHE